MALKNSFKLEKLKIKAYKGRDRFEKDLVGTFEVMFNPESFSQKYEIIYGKNQELIRLARKSIILGANPPI